jgi:hypothetical protein
LELAILINVICNRLRVYSCSQGIKTNHIILREKTKMKIQLILASMVVLSTATIALSGCNSGAAKGAAVGAVAGAVAGRSTGDHSDQRTREGALIGAAAGAIIGNERDKRN